MPARYLPHWRLPRGVTKGLWDYIHAPHIAGDYDEYFAQNSLFEFDEAVLRANFDRPGLLVDLGCGTGRLLMPFARMGYPCLAVDLSIPMLVEVGAKAAAENLPIERVQANLVELDCLADTVADYAICMFSTLGMIRGAEHRLQFLRHVVRMLKPGGKFILHVHNRWYNLFSREGRSWLVNTALGWLRGRPIVPGDKFFDYRGIVQMYLHVFTRHELLALLRAAGFQIVEVIPLDTERRHRLALPWLLGRLRANGWIVVCSRA